MGFEQGGAGGVERGVAGRRMAQGTQAVVDRLADYKRSGVQHVAVVFRREDLKRMLEILDLVAGTIRPAVDRA